MGTLTIKQEILENAPQFDKMKSFNIFNRSKTFLSKCMSQTRLPQNMEVNAKSNKEVSMLP